MKRFLQSVLILAVAAPACRIYAADASPTGQFAGAIEVTVVSTKDLKPLADVELYLSWPNGGPEGVLMPQEFFYTGSNGMALLHTLAGTHWLSIYKADWVRSEAGISIEAGQTNRLTNPAWFRSEIGINIEAGQTNHLTIKLVPGPRITGTISGTVRDPSGAPAAGVPVEFYPAGIHGSRENTEGKADANGRYEVWGSPPDAADLSPSPPLRLMNSVMARDLKRNLVAIQEFEEVPTNLDLTLQPGITLSGSVKNTDGAPVTNAEVDFRIVSGHTLHYLESQPVKVDERGLFSIPALPRGHYYYIWGITAKGYGSASRRVDAKNTQTKHYKFPTFVLKRADRKLAGQVLDPDGKPLAGAHGFISGEGQPQNPPTNTDGEGNFSVDAVCAGRVTVYAFAPSCRIASAKAQGGDTNVLLKLQRQGNAAYL